MSSSPVVSVLDRVPGERHQTEEVGFHLVPLEDSLPGTFGGAATQQALGNLYELAPGDCDLRRDDAEGLRRDGLGQVTAVDQRGNLGGHVEGSGVEVAERRVLDDEARHGPDRQRPGLGVDHLKQLQETLVR